MTLVGEALQQVESVRDTPTWTTGATCVERVTGTASPCNGRLIPARLVHKEGSGCLVRWPRPKFSAQLGLGNDRAIRGVDPVKLPTTWTESRLVGETRRALGMSG